MIAHITLQDTKVFYNRLIVENTANNSKEVVLVNCVLSNEFALRSKRQVFDEWPLPENFTESIDELIDFSGNVTERAPIPYLNAAVRQNGRFVDTALNVHPGTPLEMIIYLDDESAKVYGLFATFLKVTDNTSSKQEEIIVLNGCSIDPYIFSNFETEDGGNSLSAKFRAFKFPESNFVLFVGTVNVCLNECQGVPCGNSQLGFGRKKRSIPYEVPPDPNKVFEVEMTAFLKVDSPPNVNVQQMKGNFDCRRLYALKRYLCFSDNNEIRRRTVSER
ncbi:uncharacterized protein B4U80_04716 [Leptotrombidium deliense]|uniref:ZP domain-containing protein n=1 Tax=Leptotrombidium deliense TaxID=299467 RepID=A0A443S9T6_9ACAR|nr:uncharacterized protein B4U80_04716 [Leptotrombidium deliense]